MINRTHRFHGRASLGHVYKRGTVVRGQNLSLKYASNSRQPTYRAAVVVSRKVSKSAVVRNRIRRRVYELVRELSPQISKPVDMIFVVYSSEFALVEGAKLKHQVHDLLHRAAIV